MAKTEYNAYLNMILFQILQLHFATLVSTLFLTLLASRKRQKHIWRGKILFLSIAFKRNSVECIRNITHTRNINIYVINNASLKAICP